MQGNSSFHFSLCSLRDIMAVQFGARRSAPLKRAVLPLLALIVAGKRNGRWVKPCRRTLGAGLLAAASAAAVRRTLLATAAW